MTPRIYRSAGMGLLIVLSLVVLTVQSAAAQARRGGSSTAEKSEEPSVSGDFVAIDFNNVDINVFIKFISEITRKNFVIDQRVKGKVTILSPAKISIDEAFKVFESVLEVHGYTTIDAGEVIKIVPLPDARSKNIETRLREEAASPEDRVVTQVVPLTYADPDEIKKLFAPLISKSSVMLAYSPTNTLIITDVHSNIKRLLGILKTIDVAGVGMELSVIPLAHADAESFVGILTSVFAKTGRAKQAAAAAGEAAQFVADERTNTIVVLASRDDTEKINELIKLLDKEIPRGEDKIRVYRLEHATAEELAKVLQTLSGGQTSAAAKGKKTTPVVSGDVKITADKATNSLIIMAGKDDYGILEEIIRKLDIPRAMVYIEALIMEVNMTKSFNIGTEWQAFGEAAYNKRKGAYGGGFSSTGGFDPTAIATTPGFALGIISTDGGIQVGTNPLTGDPILFPNIGAIVQAFKSDQDVNILSTPQILTTDNEEATIFVGKNVPYQTRARVASGSTTVQGISDIYSSYEYKDVGKNLKITPQISKDRMVRLQISLEVKALAGADTATADRPTTLNRTVDTTVIVKDSHTVVIGGLIDDTVSSGESEVPCLGSIPGLGWLFKSASSSDDRTNLYVFLTPHVIQSPAEAQGVFETKKSEIDGIKDGKIKMYEQETE